MHTAFLTEFLFYFKQFSKLFFGPVFNCKIMDDTVQ